MSEILTKPQPEISNHDALTKASQIADKYKTIYDRVETSLTNQFNIDLSQEDQKNTLSEIIDENRKAIISNKINSKDIARLFTKKLLEKSQVEQQKRKEQREN